VNDSYADFLRTEAADRHVVVPTKRTLDRYGLTDAEWLQLLAGQGWCCAVCKKTGQKWNTDHEHVPGWAKLPPDERKRFVRGVLCWFCNKFSVQSNLTAKQAASVAAYLERYEARRDLTGRRS